MAPKPPLEALPPNAVPPAGAKLAKPPLALGVAAPKAGAPAATPNAGATPKAGEFAAAPNELGLPKALPPPMTEGCPKAGVDEPPKTLVPLPKLVGWPKAGVLAAAPPPKATPELGGGAPNALCRTVGVGAPKALGVAKAAAGGGAGVQKAVGGGAAVAAPNIDGVATCTQKPPPPLGCASGAPKLIATPWPPPNGELAVAPNGEAPPAGGPAPKPSDAAGPGAVDPAPKAVASGVGAGV